ncbi:hypothetical protein JTB14_012327 [Gonioctena quinquepunctata]|nr:hypothetical protein JTB14_012327 [Gonioctena quinquepunctata]
MAIRQIDEIQKDNEEEEQFLDFVEGKASAEDEFRFKSVVRKAGSFVVFSYENELYPGKIVAFDDDVVIINAMQKSLKLWKWPSRRDQLEYQWSDVLGSIERPTKVSKRGFFSVPEYDICQ